MRDNPPWFGVWRRRLALSAAVASLARSGRSEDAGVLRDAFHLTRPGADPGPGGRRLQAWRALTAASSTRWRTQFDLAIAALQLRPDKGVAALEAAAGCAEASQTGPFAAARAYSLAHTALTTTGATGDESETLAAWLADAILAQKLAWPFAMPLLTGGLRKSGRRSPGDSQAGEGALVLFGYANAAADAVDLAADLARRANELAETAPKLRAKGAGAALEILLDEDSLSAAKPPPGLSERGARRLFERLAALGVVRELTGRAAFRLYGL